MRGEELGATPLTFRLSTITSCTGIPPTQHSARGVDPETELHGADVQSQRVSTQRREPGGERLSAPEVEQGNLTGRGRGARPSHRLLHEREGRLR